MSYVKFEKISIKSGIVIKRTFYNEITILDVKNSFEYLLENDLHENHKIIALITDIRQTNVNFSLMEFRRMLSYIRNNSILSNLPMAVIYDSPVHNLFPTLASITLGIRVKPFNSIDDAILWIENLK